MNKTNTVTEISVIADIEKLPDGGETIYIEASEEQRRNIAARLQIPAVKQLRGGIKVSPLANGARVSGRLRAVLVRECVVSLEQLDEVLDEEFDLEFINGAGPEGGNPEEYVELTSPEMLENNLLDLGEILIQQTALLMAPFPRKTGARSLADIFGEERESSPFEALRPLTEKSDENQ